MPETTMDKIVSLAKRRGFVFPSSEIYGGLNSCWDYGPFGVELKKNIQEFWWRSMTLRPDVVGLDAAILMHPKVWEASGHVASFSDPFVTCSSCGSNYRADQVFDAIWQSAWWQSFLETMKGEKTSLDFLHWAKGKGKKSAPNLALVLRPEVTLSWMAELHRDYKGIEADFKNFVGKIGARADGTPATPCPNCGGELAEPKPANLMLATYFGPVQETAQKVYLRPETAQGIYVNYLNVQNTARLKVPFGIAQVGKAFRNEITPGNFIFRTREFEQMEMQFFVKPGDDGQWFEYWREQRLEYYVKLGIRKEKLRFHPHEKEELAHYAKAACDVQYEFPFGWQELEGIHNRTDFDLKRHQEFSGKSMLYFDDATNEKYLPYIIETSAGLNRTLLTVIVDAYWEDTEHDRVVLKLHPRLAPVKAVICPLVKKDGLAEIAEKITEDLRWRFPVVYDQQGSIGKRYYRQDEAGTPYGITVDYQTKDDQTVTLRDRDTLEQIRLPYTALAEEIEGRLRKA
jgi:glycyl-tRNA synthetase